MIIIKVYLDKGVDLSDFSTFKKKWIKALETCEKDINKKNVKITEEKKLLKEREAVVEEILSRGVVLEASPETLERARERNLRGNPPKKNKERDISYGDAINWEIILEHTDKKKHLVIISNDGDYADNIYGQSVLNLFLKKEWKKLSRSKIDLFEEPGSFINLIEKKDVVSRSEIKEIKNKIIAKEYICNSRFDKILQMEGAHKMVEKLTPIERKMLEMRYGLIDGVEHSLGEVAQELGISSDEIDNQISLAIKKIKNSRIHAHLTARYNLE